MLDGMLFNGLASDLIARTASDLLGIQHNSSVIPSQHKTDDGYHLAKKPVGCLMARLSLMTVTLADFFNKIL